MAGFYRGGVGLGSEGCGGWSPISRSRSPAQGARVLPGDLRRPSPVDFVVIAFSTSEATGLSPGQDRPTQRPSIVDITPTCADGLDRARLLRHSLAIVYPDIPHHALVDTADRPPFRRLRQYDPARSRLELIATADLLPRGAERERRSGAAFVAASPSAWAGGANRRGGSVGRVPATHHDPVHHDQVAGQPPP